jgi:hypothetical protein
MARKPYNPGPRPAPKDTGDRIAGDPIPGYRTEVSNNSNAAPTNQQASREPWRPKNVSQTRAASGQTSPWPQGTSPFPKGSGSKLPNVNIDDVLKIGTNVAMDAAVPGSSQALAAIKTGIDIAKKLTKRSPYAPMTWIENNSAGGIYPDGLKAGLDPYKTHQYQIQPLKTKKDADGNVIEEEDNSGFSGEATSGAALAGGGNSPASGTSHIDTSNFPTFQWPPAATGDSSTANASSASVPYVQGNRSTPAQRMHRNSDPLHQVKTRSPESIVDPHSNRLGTTWGDQHTQSVSGLGRQATDQTPESIRNPKPE